MLEFDNDGIERRTYGSTTVHSLYSTSKPESTTIGEGLGRRRRSSVGSEFVDRLSPQCIQCCCRCIRMRYLTAVMCCLGFAIIFGFRCNSAVATGHFRNLYNSTLIMNATRSEVSRYQWSASVVGTVESSYFWGCLATQVPGGIMASWFSATRLFAIAILASSMINLLLPTAFNTSFGLVIFLRVTQGLLEGFTYPACHGIWRYWAPPLDRSRLATIAFSGVYAGAFLGILLSGLLTESMGWPAPFYFYGGAGILWFCIWQPCIFEKPSVHPCISEEEHMHIEVSIGENMDVHDRISDIPWLKFFTSMPVYAIIVANFARNWTFYLLVTQQTKYFSDVFEYDMSKSGLFSALPHLIMAIVVPIGGQLADELRARVFTTTVVRKLFNCIGFGVEAVFLLGVGYTASATTAIACLMVAVSFSGLAISGFNVNHLDIGPRYASILMGLSNGFGTIASIVVPIVAVQLIKDHRQESWSKVFLIASLVHIFGVIFYAIFASGEKQEWAIETSALEEEEEEPWKPPMSSVPSESSRRRLSSGRATGDGKGGVMKSLETGLFPVPTGVSTFVQGSHR